MRRSYIDSIVIATLVLATLPLHAADEKPATVPADSAFEKVLADVDARAAKVKDFTADFRQDKFTAMLKKPLVSSGVVRVAGTMIRWDTRMPEPAVLVSDGREVKLFYPGEKLLEVYAVDARLGDLAASPLPKLATLREHFTIEPGDAKAFDAPRGRATQALRLVPKAAALRRHLESVGVLLNVEAGHIVRLETIDADGDRTRVTFTNVQLDTGVKEADLALAVPKGTTVSRPLGAGDEAPAESNNAER